MLQKVAPIASGATVGYGCAVFAPDPTIEPPLPPTAATGVAPWRWWVHLGVIGIYPLLIGVISAQRHDGGTPALPTDTSALLLVCAAELGVFALIFGGAPSSSQGETQDADVPGDAPGARPEATRLLLPRHFSRAKPFS